MFKPPQKAPLSVTIITHNEEKNIRECLESVLWAQEIIVVDSVSSDNTAEIAREYTEKVVLSKWPGFAKQKQFALDLCTCDWVLSLDADERVRPELAQEIQKLINSVCKFDGYRIARRSFFLNKWMKHCGWYPGYQVRLLKRVKTTVSRARVHEGFLVDGNIGTLQNDIDHFSHPSLHNSLEKLNRYSTLEALDRLDRKKVSWYHFVLHPISAFLIKYIRQKGFLDGIHGFLLSWISAFLKTVMYMKIWWLQRAGEEEVNRTKRTAK
jgi:glycosyltransferase involved in cell wall biosynthesis